MMILVNCGCCGVASGYGCAVWSTYGATGVQGTAVLYEEERRTHDMTKMKISAIIILSSSTHRDLVLRDQDQVYIYAT